MSKTIIKSATLWADINSGRIVCGDRRCQGGYLSSSIENAPRRKTHITPLGTWEKLDADEIAYLASKNIGCENCGVV